VSMLGSVLDSVWRTHKRVYIAASKPSSAIGTILRGMLRGTIENAIGDVPGKVFGVHLEAP